MTEFKLYSWSDAVKCRQGLNHIVTQKYFAKEGKRSKITTVSISKSGWKINVNGIEQFGFYVTIAFENKNTLCPNEFAVINGFTEDFSAKHNSIDYSAV